MINFKEKSMEKKIEKSMKQKSSSLGRSAKFINLSIEWSGKNERRYKLPISRTRELTSLQIFTNVKRLVREYYEQLSNNISDNSNETNYLKDWNDQSSH